MINQDLTEWCPQRFKLIEIVKELMPKGIREHLYSIIERRSEFTLMNHATVIMSFDSNYGNHFEAKQTQVSLMTTEMETLHYFARIATEMYNVKKG